MRGADRRKARIERGLRSRQTDAERKRWFAVRDRRLSGFKFVRQEAIGPFIVDFVCRDKRLVVEVDGGQHADSAEDAARDAFLAGEGYRVMRFWNNDVLKTPRSVGEVILTAAREIAADPTPNPSQQGGGERAAASGEDMS